MPNVRWADMDDEDSDLEVNEEAEQVMIAGGGHRFSTPFSVNGVSIDSSHDVIINHDLVREQYMLRDRCPEKAEENWILFFRDLTCEDDQDEMDGAAFEFSIMMCNDVVTHIEQIDVPIPPVHEDLSYLEDDEVKNYLAQAAKDLTLDVFETDQYTTSFTVTNPVVHDTYMSIAKRNQTTPPLCPIPTGQVPVLLRFCGSTGTQNMGIEERRLWEEVLSDLDSTFPIGKVDTYYDETTYRSSKSNRRPAFRRAVHIVYDDGSIVDIGTHGYYFREDRDFKLELSNIELSLDELFSAPGGEGMSIPTPSHILHQLVSAVLASCLMIYSPTVEPGKTDLSFSSEAGQTMSDMNIDFTTSAGIFNKALEPSENNPDYVYQGAVSKYDLASVFIHCTDAHVQEIIYKSVANCLACEYSYYFRISELEMTGDLNMQSAIHSSLSSMSKRKTEALGKMCYDAVLLEGLDQLVDVDINEQGMPWRKKRDILVRSIDNLKPKRGKVAFPPIPLGEIKGFRDDTFSIDVCGHHFVAYPYTIQGDGSAEDKYHMEDCKSFLESYPVSGIIPYEESVEILDMLDEHPLAAVGQTHQGPGRDFEGYEQVFCEAANEIYQSSAFAQFAEVRADIVRLIKNCPIPKAGCWAQAYVYKGKVCVWYRCRDAPNSEKGFRIDWFAVSSFKVAGSSEISNSRGTTLHLWPRQRLRSQEMDLVHQGPRRLKLVLFSMLEKSRSTNCEISEIVNAWSRLALTLNTSTYASGKEHLTCRFLSATISSPSSPFHQMAKKLVDPVTLADVAYLRRLRKVLVNWQVRDQYRDRAEILGLPRSFSQLESYWQMWVPSDFANATQSMTECVIGLHDEAQFLEDTMDVRVADLTAQHEILQNDDIEIDQLRESIRNTCTLPTGGKMCWSWIGSFASAYALNERSSAKYFDRAQSIGTRSRTLVDHLTVRHSARLDMHNNVQKGTVAEMIIDQGLDKFLSTVTSTYRFLYLRKPVFFNHPKKGEHKQREISITDPDSRVALSDAEHICGTYGKRTRVDFLKDPRKNSKFYRVSARTMSKGGGIQSSDATRYGPSMSNFAISVMLIYLGVFSMHLKWSSVVYARLAYREMLISTEICPYLEKMCTHEDVREKAYSTLRWINEMPIRAFDEGTPVKSYTTAHHMGQGMSHHSSSLMHAGGLIVSVDCAKQTNIKVAGIEIVFEVQIMVTSDDSTIIVEPNAKHDYEYLNRKQRQVASRIFLQLIRVSRDTALRAVSVCPNLVKEIISAVKGEFNSQDTGIGDTCPILGFREMVSLMVTPSAPSLIGDYLNIFSISRDVGMAGQGLVTASYMHTILIDSVEERWKLTAIMKDKLLSLSIVPNQLIKGAQGVEILNSACSFLDVHTRAAMLKEAIEVNAESEDLDPHTTDSVFSSLMHVKISMSRQHRQAISVIKENVHGYRQAGKINQAIMLDDCLRATLSSARSRNLGRIAFRIRNRIIKPRDYRGVDFQEDTMIESTLNWLHYLEQVVSEKSVNADDISLANSLAGHVKVMSRQRAAFPRPPRLRYTYRPLLVKPKFILNHYGRTPFGQHAIARSGCSVIAEFTSIERQQMQEYLAKRRHLSISEHVDYGGSFVISWHTLESGIIVSYDISNKWSDVKHNHIMRGDFSPDAIRFLQGIADEHKNMPILALHSYDGIRGMWHCIHKGVCYNVVHAYQIEDHVGSAIIHVMPSGENVLLVLQGFADSPIYTESVPKADEIRRYQNRDLDTYMPSIVSSVEEQNILHGSATCATYGTVVKYKGKDTLIYSEPTVRTLPRDDPSLHDKIPYLRSKVISGMSAAGYWHHSLRGTAFRAYLRGSFFQETIWTGGVIGWMSSTTSVPSYYSMQDRSCGVRALVIFGGYDDVDQISRYNPDIFSEGYKLVCKSRTETYSTAIKVKAKFNKYIFAYNGYSRFNYESDNPQFLSTALGNPSFEVEQMTRDVALTRILNLLDNVDEEDAW